MHFKILTSTGNSGQYDTQHVTSLSAAKGWVRSHRHSGGRTYWRQEGDDICAYASRGDMDNEDKAIARLRPVANEK